MKFSLLISHHNFLIADHQINLCEQYGISIYPQNVELKSLDKRIRRLQPKILIMCRQNYAEYTQTAIGNSPFQLLIISADQLFKHSQSLILYTTPSITTEVIDKIHAQLRLAH